MPDMKELREMINQMSEEQLEELELLTADVFNKEFEKKFENENLDNI